MQWRLHELGFLPNQGPLERLADGRFEDIERLGRELPLLVYNRAFRHISAQRLAGPLDWDEVASSAGDRELERLFMLYSYFASAYVHAPGLPETSLLPSYIAVPLVRLAAKVERPPILSYASYCLHNWRRLDASKPVALGNIELLQNFSRPGDGKQDEDWFILVHVDIEARAGAGLIASDQAAEAVRRDDPQALQTALEALAGSLELMNKTLNRMPEGCSAEVYFAKVRPYIFGFNGVVYEGCFDNHAQSLRGETGAQSSIIPSLLGILGIRHKDSMLTHHLEDMRKYMPAPHRQFIRERVSVRELVQQAGSNGSAGLKGLYNACLQEVLAFRSRHFEYAINYIERKVANPIATGGTPFIPWLRQLIDETREYVL